MIPFLSLLKNTPSEPHISRLTNFLSEGLPFPLPRIFRFSKPLKFLRGEEK